jgi:hypothetical protein
MNFFLGGITRLRGGNGVTDQMGTHEALGLEGIAADGECVLTLVAGHIGAWHVHEQGGPHFDRLIDTGSENLRGVSTRNPESL